MFMPVIVQPCHSLPGLDEGDMKAIDKRYKHIDLPCQLDKDDQRFVLKGTAFNPLDVINVLTGQRGYKMEYNPQQHSIPLKAGNADDKWVEHIKHVRRFNANVNRICFQICHDLPPLQADEAEEVNGHRQHVDVVAAQVIRSRPPCEA